MKAAVAAVALALTFSAQAQYGGGWDAGPRGPDVSYRLLPAPWTKICEPGDWFDSYQWPPGAIEFVCRESNGTKYVGLELSRDCAPFHIEQRGDGWYRITCHLVKE